MGSEADAEATAANAVDSDGSVSWEDFFGTSTDLVPQLLGMFDELARRGNGYTDHVVLPSTCNIPAVLQKRLSLVSHRGSIFGQFCPELAKSQQDTMNEQSLPENNVDVVVEEDVVEKENVFESQKEDRNERIEEKPYRRESNGLTPLRYDRRCRRPLSGSSVASSTSSSGCSNQGNACTINPYLASVESLADTCASSQGSGDSGVVTVSETNCRIGNDDTGQRRNSAEEGPPCHKPRYCDPHRNPMERVLLEIVDTEAIYVEHLRQVIQGYLIYWRNDPASFVHQMQLSDLFSNIEDIFEFNREFLKEIEKCGLDPVCVANTFIKHNSGFKVYTEYCTNYPRTVSVLTDLMGQEGTANAFRERQAALGHALPLGSFLLKPVQRILKYHLLLQNLSKEYGADCDLGENEAEGRKAIEAALAAMTGIARHINAMKRRHEHAVRVQEIQSLLYGWSGPDLTTSGELVAEGRFRMRGAKAPRHAFLFDRMLLLTKKKEDGLLVYKAHIMCSNLMLIESIPGEPLSFHVIPFDNPRLQYTLQARNLEQKREWTLQIKRVMLENYNAEIPMHARQLVLQLGQTQPEDDALADRGSAKKQHSTPPEYLEKRKQERERRRSETGLRQRFKKSGRKSETTTEDSPASPRKNQNDDSNLNDSREQGLRSSDGRGSKVKDRFTGWRRKSEPGFQSYVCLNQSDEEQKEDTGDTGSATVETECAIIENDKHTNSPPSETKENNEQQAQAQTVEEIVGRILMQNQEFQKLLEKQRTNSILNVRQQQRFNKRISADTSDDSDSENTIYNTDNSVNNRVSRTRAGHRERLVKTNNTLNSLSSPRDHQPALQLLYDNLNKTENNKSVETNSKNKVNHVQEKKALFDAFKRQSIVTESKIIKTALRIRENSATRNEEPANQTSVPETEVQVAGSDKGLVNGENMNEVAQEGTGSSKGFGNYDNLQHVWEGLQEEKGLDGNDSPTRPAVWLTKLCEGLPTSPQKCGSLPRSFQIHPNSNQNVTKSRFLQRDGKPMSERPFTIASDKPAEINLEDMERYASTCQPEGRIAKFPTSVSTSTSTFFCSLDDTLTDAYSEVHVSSTTTNIHPDHKIYRPNTSGSTIFKNVLSKAGNRLQGLRNTMSTETLECSEELERTKYFRSLSTSKLKKKSKLKHSRESSSDVEELVGCTARGSSDLRIPSLYYKQGSSSLGARIAQSDYADPSILFSESKRQLANSSQAKQEKKEDEENAENRESETDSFYEKSFETIENYVDADVDEAFRDSAIFSDIEEVLVTRPLSEDTSFKSKVAPPIPAKKRTESLNPSGCNSSKCKPTVAQKPDYLKVKSAFLKGQESDCKTPARSPLTEGTTYQCSTTILQNSCAQNNSEDKDDVSAGQSQAGWVRKIVGQFQGHVET
ncbi:guanine nucleotide exchange factor in mesoderm isoform X2 [Megachile rotundata]|uniref:guanine nucleotide exchange factor in mesoderm isoform X2 n=2 Tax=Megachile rotundata TaxID=143995 RepID=UPI000258E4AD|nr:PREDICTED: dentin sialophosphoprotein isoform X1 [Megachile rotundata]XP_012141406.1 PREDICTED: dentin sialophosphoprotein isoform X1 [Megachile rotundata]